MNEQNDKVFQMRVSEEFLRRIDDWRRDQTDLPSRAESIRRLVEKAMGLAQVPRSPLPGVVAAARQYAPAAADVLREMATDPKASAKDQKAARRALRERRISEDE